jgi:hypothetical protein
MRRPRCNTVAWGVSARRGRRRRASGRPLPSAPHLANWSREPEPRQQEMSDKGVGSGEAHWSGEAAIAATFQEPDSRAIGMK